SLWHFYLALALVSIVSSFFSPAQGVAIRVAVPPQGLISANALMQQVTFGMRIVGPSCAVILVEAFGARSCYVIDSASFIVSASLIASLTFAAAKATPSSSIGSPNHPKRGLRSVWSDM